jgi:hypothetical protein
MMTLPWEVAKRMYHEACCGYDAMGWAEGESDEDDGRFVSRFHLGDQMVMIGYTELD